MPSVLIIEDEPDIALSLRHGLTRDGLAVHVSVDGEGGLAHALQDGPDLILLDLSLPGIDGTEVCRRLREDTRTRTIPIIMLTARVEEADLLAGLESGADDYVTKPFSIREVVARVRAVLRRAESGVDRPRVLRQGSIELDEAARLATIDGQTVTLTRKEFDLLAYLMRRPGRVASRDRLLSSVWGYRSPGETRTVDVHVRQLRRKLAEPASSMIETVVGVGYRFRATPADET